MLEVTPKIFNQPIGILLYKEGIIYFEYAERFKNQGIEISPLKLPVNLTGVYTNKDDKSFQGLPGVFFDSLPDKFGTKVIEQYYKQKGLAATELNFLQKLIFIGNRGMGAIEYEPCEKLLEFNETKELLDLKQMYLQAKKVIKNEPIEAIRETLLFMDSTASAGGARAKAIIKWNKKENKIISGSHNIEVPGYTDWLIKFDSTDSSNRSFDFMKLEYIYMTLAKEVGITIPEIDLIYDDNLTHYLIKRFDRIGTEKIHLHSAANMAHVDFNFPNHYSYDDLLRLTRFITKDSREVEQMYKRAVFNVIARNQDDHAKNFSFLMDKTGEWKVSPAYDITYANGAGFTKNHQMTLQGKNNDFTKRDLLNIAIENDINEKKAEEIIGNTIEIAAKFYKLAKKYNLRNDLIALVQNDLRLKIGKK